MRIPRDEIFIKTAFLFSERGTCLRAKVGCVITKDNRIVSTGYVGSKPGEPHCLDEGCIIDHNTGGCIRTIHAEENAINYLKSHGIEKIYDSRNWKLYCTLSPCLDCAILIHTFGITHVVYAIDYRKDIGINYLKNENITIEKYNGRLY